MQQHRHSAAVSNELRETIFRLLWRFEREYQLLTDGQFGSIEDWREVAEIRSAIEFAPIVEGDSRG